MQVDFNNLRKQACYAYDDLCDLLNAADREDGKLQLNPDTLKREMDNLRMNIGFICCVYQKDEPNFQPVDITMKTFNEEVGEL